MNDHNGADSAGQARRWVRLVWVAEAVLVLFALGLAWLVGAGPAEMLSWHTRDAALGALASLPLLALMLAMMRWPVGPARALKQLVVEGIIPLFRHATLAELALVSLLAGVGEELLFRGLLQQWLEGLLGRWWALGLASLVFGLCHWVSNAYAALAAVIGAYLGWLFVATGGLLAPVVTHALYDFVALVYLTRIHGEDRG